MIIEDVANLFEELEKQNTHKEIARHFGRERKFVIGIKNGCSFVLNPEFIAGLKSFGYEIVLKKVEVGCENDSKRID